MIIVNIWSFVKTIKYYSWFFEVGWYVPKTIHLLFLKFVPTNNIYMLFGKLVFFNSLQGVSLLTDISILPLFRYKKVTKMFHPLCFYQYQHINMGWHFQDISRKCMEYMDVNMDWHIKKVYGMYGIYVILMLYMVFMFRLPKILI